MKNQQKQHLLNALESIDLDRKEALISRRKIQENLDDVNNNLTAIGLRLQNLETIINNL